MSRSSSIPLGFRLASIFMRAGFGFLRLIRLGKELISRLLLGRFRVGFGWVCLT